MNTTHGCELITATSTFVDCMTACYQQFSDNGLFGRS
jgi:hypothetical protein